MSHEIRDLVWHHSRARGPARMVLLVIADHADERGVAWPGYATLLRMSGYTSRSTVVGALEYLESIDELAVNRPSKLGGRNSYRVNVGLLRALAAESGPSGGPVHETDRSAKQTGPRNGNGIPSRGPLPVRDADRIRQGSKTRAGSNDAPARSAATAGGLGAAACAATGRNGAAVDAVGKPLNAKELAARQRLLADRPLYDAVIAAMLARRAEGVAYTSRYHEEQGFPMWAYSALSYAERTTPPETANGNA